jgi:hypothetical protein
MTFLSELGAGGAERVPGFGTQIVSSFRHLGGRRPKVQVFCISRTLINLSGEEYTYLKNNLHSGTRIHAPFVFPF